MNAVSDLPWGYWRSTLEKQAWTLTETLYQFHIRLSDNPLFYERSYNFFVRGKAGDRTEFKEPSDTADQRTRQQCSQRQMIDTRSSAGVSLIDQFRQPGRSSEGFGIGSRYGVPRKGAFGKDLFGEVEGTRIAAGCSRRRIPGEVQTATEVDCTEEVCGQTNQEIHRAALSEHKNSGLKEILTEEKILERSVESSGPNEHYAVEKDYVQSQESDELSDELSDDDNLFEEISDTDFSDEEEFDVNDARRETSFASSLKSVACDNVNAIASDFGGGVKANRNYMLGAWALMELKTGSVNQKFCKSTKVTDETQMCTSECTVDTLENWTSPGGTDRQLVSETQKGQNDKAAGDRTNFAELGKELKVWVQSQLSESQPNGSVSVEPTDEHQVKSAGIDRTGKTDRNSMTTALHSWVRDEQQPRRKDSSEFSSPVKQKVDRGIASQIPEIAKPLLENRSMSRKKNWSRLEASRQKLWQDYSRNGSYSGRRVGHPFKHLRKKIFVCKCTSV